MINPLLTEFELPPFSYIKLKHFKYAINHSINNYNNLVNTILNNNKDFNWENLCEPLLESNDKIEKIFGIITHLNSVKNSKPLRKIYEEILVLISMHYTSFYQNKKIFFAYQYIKNKKSFIKLSLSKQKTINNILKDFVLSGILLSDKKKKRYCEIIRRICELGAIYDNNIMDYTKKWKKIIYNKDVLDGLSKKCLSDYKKKIKNNYKWILTLNDNHYHNIMKYCNNQKLRKEMYYAYNTKASENGSFSQLDNSNIIKEILNLRHEISLILGFKSYAHYSLNNKMIKNENEVINFLENMAQKINKTAKKEIKQLSLFINEKTNLKKINMWDLSYFSEKQKKKLFQLNEEEIKQYFPEQNVIHGMFDITNKIFGIKIRERKNIDIWHKKVRFFDVYDIKDNYRGGFYLDIYERKNKKNGAWMNVCSNLLYKNKKKVRNPIAYLVCNFKSPTKKKPLFFSHREILTLFHEFGHVLHHILTCIKIPNVSGVNGIPWDAIEISSQLMEHWCWEPEVLLLISSYFDNKNRLPKNVLNKILLSKNYHSSIFILRQIELSLFDFLLHKNYQPSKKNIILDIFFMVKKQISLLKEPNWIRPFNSFSHIFSGGYAAGYYSYLWSHMLSSDIYSKFQKKGIFNRDLGISFIDNFLSQGGSQHPLDLFYKFMGRKKPNFDKMLKFYNI